MASWACGTLSDEVRAVAARTSFPLLDALPASLRDVTLDFLWSHERLWALELAVERVALEDLRWHLSLPMWAFEGVPFAISPTEVQADPRRYRAQYARTMAADLAFPLHALARPSGTLTLLDGVHRLLKADLLGQAVVAVKKLPSAVLDAIAA